MTAPHRLAAARAKAAADTRARAEKAIRDLLKRREAVTFVAVAAEARVSTGYLHRHPELAPRIRQLRDAPATRPRPVPVSTEPTIIDTLREHLRRMEAAHAQQLQALRKENHDLRRELETMLGEVIALRGKEPTSAIMFPTHLPGVPNAT